ncbi:hypothetical protein PC128_g10695 [Phytophthora cactorum]|nr:hypothetical protein PC120_g7709 [Phytophthora cactorum]KAG3074787.1 hypothetical protein PC121_g8242 [Phytophthora cactorum]KAG3192119.1 hypothetical protein PC128_g10695 [Phytophthora cactorum]KAG4053880.1 hypothetical protein PC123_g10982 [Phytophthora cactorum]
MFLVAVARQRWDAKRHCIWNGKIGLWRLLCTNQQGVRAKTDLLAHWS